MKNTPIIVLMLLLVVSHYAFGSSTETDHRLTELLHQVVSAINEQNIEKLSLTITDEIEVSGFDEHGTKLGSAKINKETYLGDISAIWENAKGFSYSNQLLESERTDEGYIIVIFMERKQQDSGEEVVTKNFQRITLVDEGGELRASSIEFHPLMPTSR